MLITDSEGRARLGGGVQMLRGPPLLLKRSDFAPLWHFSEAFEHLEETESLFEENSETNLLIKSGSGVLSACLLVVKEES